jgi:uncharacterized RDD family membrane protein YckC
MKTAILLMPFTEELRPRFEFIQECGRRANVDVQRVDTYAYSGNILAAISRAIVSSDIVIADLSRANANVVYEVGVAQSMGHRIVLVTDDRNTVPFDLRTYRTELVQDESSATADALTNAIRQALATSFVAGPLGGNVVFGQRVFLRRTLAFMVDLALTLIASWSLAHLTKSAVVLAPAGAEELRRVAGCLGFEVPGQMLDALLPVAPWVYIAYVSLAQWLLGATLGQRLVDLKVITYDGTKPTFARSLGRSVASILTVITYGVGFLWCLKGPGYRTFHDIASDTIVIRSKGKPREGPVP